MRNNKTENSKPLRKKWTKNGYKTSNKKEESDSDFEVVPQVSDHIVDFKPDTESSGDDSDLDIFDSLAPTRPTDPKNAKKLSVFTTSPKVKSSAPKTSTALDIIINGNDKDYMDDATFIASESQAANRKKKKSGGFQSMGLSPAAFNAIIHKGYKVPTPIQRKCIPLIMEGGDVVGMARTGSGKTAAFLIPMIERLKAHSAKVGARAIVLAPSRELAMQTHKVAKELAKYTDLRSCLLVGGDNMEDQFSTIAGNPDIIIATPGRLLHLVVEMDLDIGTVEYIVFDEADRLFEMGFSVQLHEILYRLPPSRQTLLFSATLPKLLVDFAKAGLQDPTLIRLDVDTKISRDLQMSFFSVKQIEKEAALLYVLREIIKLPIQAAPSQASKFNEDGSKSKKKHRIPKLDDLSSCQTIVFTSTKHHVEYIGQLLQTAGYQVSYVYGALDQMARKIQIQNFRTGRTNILVVTDVAARGIDIPILSNVINYDFIDSSKVFVHRVGRTARAGRKGWAYSLITPDELPYLLDLQLFLARPLIVGPKNAANTEPISYVTDIVIGALHRDMLEDNMDWIKNKINESVELQGMQGVAINGYKHYVKSRSKASSESYARAKEVMRGEGWGRIHPLLDDKSNSYPEQGRNNLINSIANFRPPETIFEIGSRGIRKASEAAVLMRQRRQTVDKLIVKHKAKINEGRNNDSTDIYEEAGKNVNVEDDDSWVDEALIDETFRTETKNSILKRKADDIIDKTASKKQKSTIYRDTDYYLSHYQNDANTERGYSMTQQGSFAEHAQAAQLDLIGDDRESQQRNSRSLRWDSRKKNFVRGSGIGADNKKLIKTESGTKISASFKSGRFDEWQQRSKVQLPRVGEQELPGSQRMTGSRKFRHIQQKAPKELDPLTIDYERKKSKRKHEATAIGEEILANKGAGKKEYNLKSIHSAKKMAKVGKRTIGGKGIKSELKNVDQIRKIRNLKERRKQRNGRTSNKGKANGKHKHK